MNNTLISTFLLLAVISCKNKPQTESLSEEASPDLLEVSDNIINAEQGGLQQDSMPILSGTYNDGSLFLAYDGNTVTGFYSNGRYAGNPNFGCSFYFYGSTKEKINERMIKILTLNPYNLTEGPREGTFKLHGEEDDIFALIAELNGDDCWDQALGFADISVAPGVSFELSTKESWLEIRLAKSEKVYFYSNADETTKRKAYVIKNDPLFITERQGNWLKATFRGSNSETTGWINLFNTKSFAETGSK